MIRTKSRSGTHIDTFVESLGRHAGFTGTASGEGELWYASGNTIEEVLGALDRCQAYPISPRDYAHAQRLIGGSPLLRNACMGSAVAVIVPGREAYIVRRAPWNVPSFREYMHRQFTEPVMIEFDPARTSKRAQAEALRTPEQCDTLLLKGAVHKFTIGCNDFALHRITRFLYQDEARAYGQWAKERGVYSMPFSLGEVDPAGTPAHAFPLYHAPPRLWGHTHMDREESVLKFVGLSP